MNIKKTIIFCCTVAGLIFTLAALMSGQVTPYIPAALLFILVGVIFSAREAEYW